MAHKFSLKSKSKLDNEWRRENLPAAQTLKNLGLTSEDVVADIGSGIGYFTIPAAQLVNGENQVFALDISEEMLAEVKQRMADAGLSNIITIKTEEYDLKIPDASVTYALIVNVLHEIKDQNRMIDEIHRILKPNGQIAIIEWIKADMEMGPPCDGRIGKEELIHLLTSKNFEYVNSTEFATVFYGVVFRRLA
ncbi:class I SAM-dependent methyltransferase [Acetobacterium bakii]|uniref:Methyltransferase n=1 Tax=Acetobacterium bakii TaxID=52689 RepID=A0A0L6TWJ8_9FIRM|nr:class I SAM-dependent methyltransferase [Acetobacterium bakii]KNZ40437.1 methyltransferase [Acetobacterium bakii]